MGEEAPILKLFRKNRKKLYHKFSRGDSSYLSPLILQFYMYYSSRIPARFPVEKAI